MPPSVSATRAFLIPLLSPSNVGKQRKIRVSELSNPHDGLEVFLGRGSCRDSLKIIQRHALPLLAGSDDR
jgi:hypothetical protein